MKPLAKNSIQPLINVAKGMEKNTPQNPNIVPNKNTARIIIIG